MKNLFRFVFCFLLLIFCSTVYSQIRINEFLIDPAQKVELINSGTATVDITGWFLDDSGGSTFFTIPETIIPANSCTVFEGDFNLNKTSADTIRLFDKTAPPTSPAALLIDSFSYKASSGSGISFKRVPDASGPWSSGSADLGFFNNTVNSCVVQPTAVPSLTSFPTPTQISLTPTPFVLEIVDNIFLSEMMVNPLIGEKERVELYNGNDFNVELTDWFIDDLEDGGSTAKSITLSIASKEFSVVELGTSLFNNEGDQVRLLDPNRTEKDKFEYLYSEKNKSWGRISFDAKVYCLQDPTFGTVNGPCIANGDEEKVLAGKKTLTPTLQPKKQSVKTNVSQSPSPYKKTGLISGSGLVKKKDLEGEVLSEQTTAPIVNRPRLHKTLSVISLSYGLLTLASIFLKIKTGVIS